MRIMTLVLALAALAFPLGCADMGCAMREKACAERCRGGSGAYGGFEDCRRQCEATNPCR